MEQYDRQVLQWAQYYASINWIVIPVKEKSKKPDLGNGWEKQIDNVANIKKLGPNHNIGINLGASDGLTDIDLDCDEARRLAQYFLPSTKLIFGRKSALNSHWLYLCSNAQSKKYVDPAIQSINVKSMILEIRATGQTVFPPSIHENTHELIEWNTTPDITTITKLENNYLEECAGRLASAVLLVRYLKPGIFHDATVALAGALLRIWNEEYTNYFIKTIGLISGMSDIDDRIKIVKDTAKKLRTNDQNISGWPSLKQYLPTEVVDKIILWLNVTAYKALQVFNASPTASNGNQSSQANEHNSNTICIHTWGELAKKRFQEMKWIITSFLPPGVSLIAGRPKQGKSWLVHAIGLLVAAGRPVFGLTSTKCDVLYMALEDSERRLQGRTRKLMVSHNLTDEDIKGFHYTLTIPYLGEGLEEELNFLLKKHESIRLVIIDVLARIRTSRKGNQSVYEHDYEVGKRLKQIGNIYPEVAFLIVHHQNKQLGDALDSISGSHGLAGGFDNTYALISGNGGLELHINGRDIEDSNPIPLLKDNDGMWTLESRESAADSRNSDTRNEIINALRNGDHSPKDISISTGIDTNTINSSLRRMCIQNLVTKVTRGKYILNEINHAPITTVQTIHKTI